MKLLTFCSVLVCFTAANNLVRAAEPVDSIVLKIYDHGVPYGELTRLGPTDCPRLVELLGDESKKPYWANIVTALGVVGDAQVTAPITNLLESRFSGEVDPMTFEALLAAPRSLGHAAAKGNTIALEYLLRSHLIETWENKQLTWRSRNYDGQKLSILMAKLTIQGLAASGTTEAKQLLIRMRDDQSSQYARLRTYAEANIREGLAFMEKIEREGRSNVFRNAPR